MRRPRLQKSLTVNAFSLMTATLGTNALGFVFWTLAARLKVPAVVGRATAAIAALTLLATIAQLNLTNLFVRLLPAAGRLGSHLIRRGYLAAIALSLVAGAVYVSTGLSATVVTGGWGERVLFTVSVAVLAIFALQDSVLTALRLTPWVAVENMSFGAAKLVLLPLFVLLPIAAGIVVSWMVPAAVAVVVVSTVLFRRVLPARESIDGTLPGRRRLASFVAGEYVGNICATATVQLMPLLVVARLGPSQAAYFALPWLMAMGITFLMWNVASTFEVELLSEMGHSDALLRRSLHLWGAVVLAAVTVCVVGAHPLLELAGPRYAAHGTGLLRLIGLSTPFGAVIALYSTLAWLDQRVWMLAGLQAVMGVAMLGLTLALLPHVGLEAVGWANLTSQALAAVVMVPLALRRVRRGELVAAR